MRKNRSRAYVHDRLYALADKLLKRHNPCAMCIATNCFKEDEDSRCCGGCPHFKKGHGCTVNALLCKLWLCWHLPYSQISQIQKRLNRLRKIAEKYNLLVARASRRETLEFGEQLSKDPWWLYYNDYYDSRSKSHKQLRHGPYRSVS